MACRIGNAPADEQPPRPVRHASRSTTVADDIACTGDDDCRQTTATPAASRAPRSATRADAAPAASTTSAAAATATAASRRSAVDLRPGHRLHPRRQPRPLPDAVPSAPGPPDRVPRVGELPRVHAAGHREHRQRVELAPSSSAVTSARRHECEIDEGHRSDDDGSRDQPLQHASDHRPRPGATAPTRSSSTSAATARCGERPRPRQAHAGRSRRGARQGLGPASCGPQGTDARLGDLRYSMIGAITDHDQPGLLGPARTSRPIRRPANGRRPRRGVADHHRLLRDLPRSSTSSVLNGEASPDEITNGATSSPGMKQLGTGTDPGAQILDAPIREPALLETSASLTTGLDKLKLPGAGWFTAAAPAHARTIRNKPGRPCPRRPASAPGPHPGRRHAARHAATLEPPRHLARDACMMNSQQARLAPTATPDDNALLAADSSGFADAQAEPRHAPRSSTDAAPVSAPTSAAIEAGFSGRHAARLRAASRRRARRSCSPTRIDEPVSFGRDWNFKQADGIWTSTTLMTQYAAQFIHHGVLAHELGHSVGQRHNFTASADAINYFDKYWKVARQGHPTGIRPRYEYLADPADGKYYSQAEIDGRVDEFAYSSVMDYKGLNEDAHGLGRYDTRSSRTATSNMVEAFKTVAGHRRRADLREQRHGQRLLDPARPARVVGRRGPRHALLADPGHLRHQGRRHAEHRQRQPLRRVPPRDHRAGVPRLGSAERSPTSPRRPRARALPLRLGRARRPRLAGPALRRGCRRSSSRCTTWPSHSSTTTSSTATPVCARLQHREVRRPYVGPLPRPAAPDHPARAFDL